MNARHKRLADVPMPSVPGVEVHPPTDVWEHALLQGIRQALLDATRYEVEMTLEQVTYSPWLGKLTPGTNYLALTTSEQWAAFVALILEGALRLRPCTPLLPMELTEAMIESLQADV